MKRFIAAILRHRTVWQLVVIAALSTSVALWILYGSYASTVRQLRPLWLLLFAITGTALVLAGVRCAEDIARSGGAGKKVRRLVLAVLGLAAAIFFVTYSFGHHKTRMMAACNASLLPDTLGARREALAAAQAGLRSPFAALPRLFDDAAGRECARSEADLARVEQGLCTKWTLRDQACTCGEERYPGARCEEPRCLYDPGKPDRFDCPGDALPEGYSGI